MDAVGSKKILYLTYDGLTDPLGQSQILPYVIGLSKLGYRFVILSFEKEAKFKTGSEIIRKITSENNIIWAPLLFTVKPKGLSKLYDAIRMRLTAFRLHKKFHFDMVHCRSYIAADVGLKMKKKFGTKFFFDMRGFWADEKKDGGSWDQSKFLFRRVYQYYKKRESQYLRNADYVIVLTEAGKADIQTWPGFQPEVPLSVIPCCADTNHFTLTNSEQRSEARKALGLPENALVISYLGSVGTWYMLDEMLMLFSLVKQKHPEAKFLFITHSSPSIIDERLAAFNVRKEDVLIREATRAEVPFFVKASDINLSFIKPVYSKISSSPTKLGEVLTMGIPVICNSKIGDVEKVVTDCNGGYVLKDFTENDMKMAVEKIPELLQLNPREIRDKAMNYYSLEKGLLMYEDAYSKVFKDKITY